MRITSIRQTAASICDVVSVETETLIIETPDLPPPSFTVKFDAKLDEPLDSNRLTPEPRYGTSTTDSKCGRGGGNSGDQFVVVTGPYKDPFHNPQPSDRVACGPAPVFDEHDFQAKAARDQDKTHRFASPVDIARAAMEGKPQPEGEWPHQPRTPIFRDVPLWQYARDYALHEFPNDGPHAAAKFADQFFGGWQRYLDKLNNGKGSGR